MIYLTLAGELAAFTMLVAILRRWRYRALVRQRLAEVVERARN